MGAGVSARNTSGSRAVTRLAAEADTQSRAPDGGQFPTAHEQASVVDRGGVCFHSWAEADTTTRSGRATTTKVPH